MTQAAATTQTAATTIAAITTTADAATTQAAETTQATTAQVAATTQAQATQTTTVAAEAVGVAPVTIRASWWGDTWRHELYNSIIDIFEADFPHVTVIREPVSWGDYWEKLTIQIAGGNATDFLCMHPAYVSDYAPRGVMAPLQPFIDMGAISLDGWEQGTIDTGVINGTLYMLAMGVTFTSQMVNLTKFEELGVDPPDFNWTWDEFKSKAVEVREAFDAVGEKSSWIFGDPGADWGQFRYYSRQRGREQYDADGNLTISVDDLEEWWTMWKDLADTNLVIDPSTGAEFSGATLEDGLFSRDRIIVTTTPVNQAALFNNTFPDKKIGIVRQPSLEGGKVGEYPEGAHYAVYANTTPEKQLAAAQLINNWLNKAESLALYQLDQGVPGNLSLKDAYMSNLTPAQLENVNFVNILSEITTPSIYAPPGASEIDSLFVLRGEEVRFGVKTPAQAAQEFMQEATEIRSRAG